MSAQLIAAGVDLAMRLADAKTQRQMARISNRVDASNVETSNRIKRSNNVAEMATNSLARYMQSLNSQRAMNDVGEAIGASTVQALRNSDASINQDILADLSAMEELGAAAATQGATGTMGMSADSVSAATDLRNSITNQLALNAKAGATYEAARQRVNLTQQMFAAPDSSVIMDSLDYSYAVAQPTSGPSNLSVIGNFALEQVAKNSGNIVSAFSGQAAAANSMSKWLPDLAKQRLGDQAMAKSQFSFSTSSLGTSSGATYKLGS